MTPPPAPQEIETPLTMRHLFIAASSVLFAAGLAAFTPDLMPRDQRQESRISEGTAQPAPSSTPVALPTLGGDLRIGDPF